MSNWVHFAHVSGDDSEEYFFDGKSMLKSDPKGNYTLSFWYSNSGTQDVALWDQALKPEEIRSMAMGDNTLTFASSPMAPAVDSNHDVNIRKAANGFIVTVGCKVFVAKTWKEASEGLGLYFRDPEAAQKKYLKKGE